MAVCPECSREIDAQATVCSHCGYKWSDVAPGELTNWGWAYSWIAKLALIVAAITSAIGCLLTIYYFFRTFLGGNWLLAFILMPLVFLNQLGVLVVFIRESRRSPPGA